MVVHCIVLLFCHSTYRCIDLYLCTCVLCVLFISLVAIPIVFVKCHDCSSFHCALLDSKSSCIHAMIYCYWCSFGFPVVLGSCLVVVPWSLHMLSGFILHSSFAYLNCHCFTCSYFWFSVVCSLVGWWVSFTSVRFHALCTLIVTLYVP